MFSQNDPTRSPPHSDADRQPETAPSRGTVRSITRDPAASPEDKLHRLLSYAARELGVQNSYLTRINPGTGVHVVAVGHGPTAESEVGTRRALAETFCRKAVVSPGPVSIHDAPHEGWADDPAYTTSGNATYLGTKVVLGDQLYGTLCFAETAPRSRPFTADNHALLGRVRGAVEEVLTHWIPPADGAAHEQAPDLLRRVHEVSRIGGWELALEDSTLRWTEQTFQLHGLPAGTSPPDLDAALAYYGESDRSTLRTALDRCTETGLPFDKELTLVTAEGRRRQVRVQGSPHLENGAVTRITGTIRDVTDRQERAQVLQLVQDQLRPLVAQAEPIVFMLDAEGQVLLSEGRDLSAFNRRPGEDVGRSVEDLCADAPAIHSLLDEALSGAVVDEVVELRGRTFQVHTAPFRDQTGSWAGCIGTAADITERTELRDRLREERDLLDQVFETSPSAIAILNADGDFVRLSPSAQEILNVDEDVFGLGDTDAPDWQLLSSDGAPLSDEERPFHQVRDSGETLIGMEYVLQWPDGTQRVLSISGAPLFDAEETFIGAVFHLDDVTHQWKTELNLRLFRKAVEQAHDAVLILRGAPRSAPGPPIAYANPAFESLTGHDADAVEGQPLSILFGPDTDPEALAPLWSALDDGHTAEGEALCYRADGTRFINHWSIAPVRDESDDLTYWLLVQRDGTERWRARKRLLEAHDDERRRVGQEMHDQMGGLLTTLQMTVELARMEVSAHDDVTEHLDDIEQRISDLARVTRSISRRLHPEELTEQGLVPALSSLARDLDRRHDLSLSLQQDLDPDGRLSALVEMTTYQIVQETVVCAAQHGEAPAIDVKLRRTDAHLYVEVRCEHAEFPSHSGDDNPHVFRSLRTWVHHLDGEIHIDGRAGSGTCIEVRLPLRPSSLPSASRPPRAEP